MKGVPAGWFLLLLGTLVVGGLSAVGQSTDTRITDTETGEEVINVDGYIPKDRSVGQTVTETVRGDDPRASGRAPSGYPEGSGYPGGEGEQQNVMVWVKEGKIVKCAYSRALLHYNVAWNNMPREVAESGKYYDDGTHGDEVAYDGIPSNIEIVDDRYIHPECWKNKLRLEAWMNLMAFPPTFERLGFDPKVLRDGELHPAAPLSFFSVGAAALQEESQVAQHGDQMEQLNAYVTLIKDWIDSQYAGYEWYPDYTADQVIIPGQAGSRGQTQFQDERFERSEYAHGDIWRGRDEGRQTMSADDRRAHYERMGQR